MGSPLCDSQHMHIEVRCGCADRGQTYLIQITLAAARTPATRQMRVSEVDLLTALRLSHGCAEFEGVGAIC